VSVLLTLDLAISSCVIILSLITVERDIDICNAVVSESCGISSICPKLAVTAIHCVFHI